MRVILAKSLVAAAVCLGLISSAAVAAKPAKADERGQMMANRALEPFRTALSKVTDLTDDEKAKTDAILDDAAAQVQAMIDDAKADRKDAKAAPGADKKEANQERRKKVAELSDSTRDKIIAELTDAQKPEFKKALAEAKAAVHENRGAGGGGAGRRAGAATKPTT